MPLYNCKTHSGLDYLITKLDDDLNPESTYILLPLDTERTVFSCDCPAGVRPTCRHRQMLPHFIEAGRVNSGWVMDWDGGQSWRQYVGPFGDDGTIEFAPSEELPGEITDPAGQFEQYQSFASDTEEPKPVEPSPLITRR